MERGCTFVLWLLLLAGCHTGLKQGVHPGAQSFATGTDAVMYLAHVSGAADFSAAVASAFMIAQDTCVVSDAAAANACAVASDADAAARANTVVACAFSSDGGTSTQSTVYARAAAARSAAVSVSVIGAMRLPAAKAAAADAICKHAV